MRFPGIRELSRTNGWLLVLALALQLCAATPSQGQSTKYSQPYEWNKPDCSDPNFAELFVDSYFNGSATVRMLVCFPAKREAEVREELSAALGCLPKDLQLTRFEDKGLTGLNASCYVRFPREGLKITGYADLQSTQDMLKKEGVPSLMVILWLPLTPKTSCDPEPVAKSIYLPSTRQCGYVLKEASGEPHIIRFTFGYDAAVMGRALAILGCLLLSPVLAALWLRRRASRAPKSKTYRWPNLFLPLYAFLFLWVVAALRFHAVGLVSFALPPSNLSGFTLKVISLLLALFLPPILVFVLCFSLWSSVRDRH